MTVAPKPLDATALATVPVCGARVRVRHVFWGLVVLVAAGCGGGESYSPTLPVTTVVEYFPTVVNAESGASMRRGQLVDTTIIMKVVDAGAYGVVCPMVNTAA